MKVINRSQLAGLFKAEMELSYYVFKDFDNYCVVVRCPCNDSIDGYRGRCFGGEEPEMFWFHGRHEMYGDIESMYLFVEGVL